MKTEPAQLKQLASLEDAATKLRELQPQLALLAVEIPKNCAREVDLRKQIAGIPADELLKISPAVQALRDELSRVEFINSHSLNCKARVSSDIAKLEANAKRDVQEFLISFRQTISEHLTDSNKIWAISLTNPTSLRGDSLVERIDSLVSNASQIRDKFSAAEVAS